MTAIKGIKCYFCVMFAFLDNLSVDGVVNNVTFRISDEELDFSVPTRKQQWDAQRKFFVARDANCNVA